MRDRFMLLKALLISLKSLFDLSTTKGVSLGSLTDEKSMKLFSLTLEAEAIDFLFLRFPKSSLTEAEKSEGAKL